MVEVQESGVRFSESRNRGIAALFADGTCAVDPDGKPKKSGKSTKGGEDDLGKAIKYVERSLSPDLWTDATHPDSKHGHKIFDEEKKAVKELQDIIEETAGCDTQLQAAVDALVAADMMLADVAITEAQASCTSGKCEKDLANRPPRCVLRDYCSDRGSLRARKGHKVPRKN